MEVFSLIIYIISICLIIYFIWKNNKEQKKITDNLNKMLEESERKKGLLLNNLPIVMYRCEYDENWTMKYLSSGCNKLTGYYPEQFLDNNEIVFKSITAKEYIENLDEKWKEVVKSKGVLKEEYEIITATGERRWVWENGQGVYDDNGNLIEIEGIILDITERKENELRLKYLTEHNNLTGIANRISFEEFYNGKKLDKKDKAIMMINIHKFGLINKVFGYKFADDLIKNISKSLIELENDNLKLFHISIDRFIFYINDYKTKEDLINIYKKVIANINLRIMEKTIDFNIGIIEVKNDEYIELEELLKNLSIAAENSSMGERFSYCFFDKEMEYKLKREIKIKESLEKSIYDPDDKNLFMVYQPIVDIKKNEIYGFEALARYKHDELGYISPIEFIAIAEESQLIHQLGLKIMELAFKFANEIVKRGNENIRISFNVSAAQLLADDFLNDINRLLKKTGARPINLKMELTETVFADNYQEINRKLNEIKALGIIVAIDDFGTGYSSLSREEFLNVDCIKIDKYFADNLLVENVEKSIISDIISMARKKGHYVIAEGIEHKYQRDYLLENNCDMIQGYYFSKPVEANIALKMIDNYKDFFNI